MTGQVGQVQDIEVLVTTPGLDPRLRDPLSEVTRKERLYLLGVSTVGITIVYTGLIPSEITTLGIKFGEANQDALLYILAVIIFYFLVAFVVYAASDFLAWRSSISQHYKDLRERRIGNVSQRDEEWIRVRDVMREKVAEAYGSRWEDAYDEVYKRGHEIFQELLMEGHSLPQVSLEEGQPLSGSPPHYALVGEHRGVEAAGSISLLTEQKKYAAANDLEAAVREHFQRWVESYAESYRYPDLLRRRRNLSWIDPAEISVQWVLSLLTNPIILIRAIFEFILPLVVGVYAILVLVI